MISNLGAKCATINIIVVLFIKIFFWLLWSKNEWVIFQFDLWLQNNYIYSHYNTYTKWTKPAIPNLISITKLYQIILPDLAASN